MDFFLFSFPDDVKEHSNEYYVETPNMKNEHTLLEVNISDKISHDLALLYFLKQNEPYFDMGFPYNIDFQKTIFLLEIHLYTRIF